MKDDIGDSDYKRLHFNDFSKNVSFIAFLFSRQVWKKALKYLIPLLIVAVVIGAVLCNYIEAMNITNIQNSQKNIVNLETEIITDDMDTVFAELMYLSKLVDSKSENILSENLKRIGESMVEKMTICDMYNKIVILDAGGKEVLRIDKKANEILIVKESELQNKADRYYFNEALALGSEEVYITSVDLLSENGEVVQPERLVIRFIKKLFDDRGETKAILILYYNAERIFKNINEYNDNMQNLILLNSEGYYLNHEESEKRLGNVFPYRETETFEKYHPDVWREISSKSNGCLVTSEGSFVFKNVDLLKKINWDYVTNDGAYPLFLVSWVPSNLIIGEKFNSDFITIMVISLITIAFALVIMVTISSSLTLVNERNKILRLYLSVLETQHEMVCRYLPDTTLIFVNDAYCRAFGKKRSELLGNKYLMSITPESHEEELTSLKRLSLADPSDTREFEVTLSDGSTGWQEWTDVGFFDESGELIEIQGTGRDITIRKQAEEEARSQTKRVEALLHISSHLNAELELDKVKSILCEEARSILQMQMSAFLRYDSNTQLFRLSASSGLPGEVARALETLSQNEIDILLNKPDKSGIITDLSAMSELPLAQTLLSHGIRTLAYSLVNRNGLPLGVLFAGDDKKIDLSKDLLALLSGLTDQAASAITNAQLFSEAKNRLSQVQALRNIDLAITGSLDLRVTFQVVLDEVTKMLGTDAAAILRLDPHTGTLKYEHWRGFRSRGIEGVNILLGEGYVGAMALNRESVHIHDLREHEHDYNHIPLLTEEDFVAYYAVPLIAKGTVLGVLEVYHREQVASNGEWLAFLETLAGQAAIAIDNAELFSKLERSNVDLLRAYDATIAGWAHALDLKDEDTKDHSKRVTELTMRIAEKIGIKEEDLAYVRRGALLHDIGKMGIPDRILLKPGKLTDEEWEIVRKHPFYAFEMLSPIVFLRLALDIPYCHHEKWDGSGYPRGLKGEQIPLAARIFAVVDVYDALTSDRPYRKAWTKEKTLEYIQEQSGKHFDPQILDFFVNEMSG